MATVANLVHTSNIHTSDINGVSFNEKLLATCSSDKTVRVWNLDDFTENTVSPLLGHTYTVHGCHFSHSGTVLATCSTDGKVILWNITTGEKVKVIEHKSGSCIRVCRFSPDGKVLSTGSDDQLLCLWDLTTYKLISCLEGHDESVVACAFSPDGAYIVSGSPTGDLRLWDGKYGHGKQFVFLLDAHDLGVSCCCFSPTYGSAGVKEVAYASQINFLLATCGYDDAIKFWDILGFAGSSKVQLQLRSTLLGHEGPVLNCEFSPNGNMLASGSGDKTVRLWNVFKGETIHVIEGHTRYVTCCAFSLDGCYLATGSNDKHVKIWKITTEEKLQDEPLQPTCPTAVLLDMCEQRSVKPAVQWSVDEVCAWLREIGMAQYETCFRMNAIDGRELSTLNQRSLENSLGISALGHRNKLLRAIENIRNHPVIQKKEQEENGVPDEYLCPITREIMKDPVIASDGYTYERAAISAWVGNGRTCSPMTNAPLTSDALTPNRTLKTLIQRFLQTRKS